MCEQRAPLRVRACVHMLSCARSTFRAPIVRGVRLDIPAPYHIIHRIREQAIPIRRQLNARHNILMAL